MCPLESYNSKSFVDIALKSNFCQPVAIFVVHMSVPNNFLGNGGLTFCLPKLGEGVTVRWSNKMNVC